MKPRPLLIAFAVFCLASAGFLPNSESRAGDALSDAFFPPELIAKAHEQLGLTEEQSSALRSAFEDAQQRVQGLQQEMRSESEKLAALAKPERVDEKAITAQADKTLDIERQIKHAQLSLMVLIKNTLTPEQQSKLTALKSEAGGLDTKMKQVMEAAQRWQQEGRDLTPLQGIKSEIDALKAQGKTAEISEALDRALKILNGSTDK